MGSAWKSTQNVSWVGALNNNYASTLRGELAVHDRSPRITGERWPQMAQKETQKKQGRRHEAEPRAHATPLRSEQVSRPHPEPSATTAHDAGAVT